MPPILHQYYDAQWWLFIHIAPFAYLAIILYGIAAWWYQNFYHEDEAEPDVITKLDLNK